MRDNDWRDPRINPRAGDIVEVDLGDGETERREVASVARRTNGVTVNYHVNGDAAVRSSRLCFWRDFADDSTVIRAG